MPPTAGPRPAFAAHSPRSTQRRPASTVSDETVDDGDYQAVTKYHLERTLEASIAALEHTIDARFDEQERKSNARFDEQEQKSNAGFAQTDKRWQDILARLAEQQRQTASIEARGLIFDALQTNRGATHLGRIFEMVPRYDETTGRLLKPDSHMRQESWRVGDFWRLKQCKYWPLLCSLHEFYETKTWPRWGLDWHDFGIEDEPKSTGAPPSHDNLLEAVQFAPDIALQELAMHLGLNYDQVEINAPDDLTRFEREYKKRLLSGNTVKLAKRTKQDMRTISPLPNPPRETSSAQVRLLVGVSPGIPKSPEASANPSEELGWKPRSDYSKGPSQSATSSEQNTDPIVRLPTLLSASLDPTFPHVQGEQNERLMLGRAGSPKSPTSIATSLKRGAQSSYERAVLETSPNPKH